MIIFLKKGVDERSAIVHSSVPVPLDDGICRDSVQKWGHFFTFTWQQLRTAPTFPYKLHRGKAGLLRLWSKEKDHNVQWASTLNSWGKSAGRRRAASLPHPFFFLCVCQCVKARLPHGHIFGLWAFIITYAGSKATS